MKTYFIGNTPIRKCDFLSKKYNCSIAIKEEFHNPGMSSKDRPAYYMITEAIKNKKIRPGGTFVEASSGNTGLGIALIAQQLGYKSKIFVSKSCSTEKINMLKAAGAAVTLCDNSNGLHDFFSTQFLAQSYAANQENAYFTNQYYNSANIKAHYLTTGPEIWNQTQGKVTHFIAGVGTGGTISGVGRFLKEKNPDIKIYGVEPIGSVLSHFLTQHELPLEAQEMDAIEGIGRTFIPGAFDVHAVDQIFQVGSRESQAMAQDYRQQAGFLTGYSSAAVLAALDEYIYDLHLADDDLLVLFFPDHGSRYLSKLYSELPVPSLTFI